MAADIGKAEDALKHVAENLVSRNIHSALNDLWQLMKSLGFLSFDSPPPIAAKDYIPVADSYSSMRRALEPRTTEEEVEFGKLVSKYVRSFGDSVDDSTAEEAPAEVIKQMAGKISG